MNVQGPGGALPLSGAEQIDASAAPSPVQEAAVVRGGSTVPATIQKEAVAYDLAHHANRNIPDLSYGPSVIDGTKNADGSWTVNVGSQPTSIMGPRPGAKPFDIVSYTVKNGQVSVTPPPNTPHWGDPGWVMSALASHDNKAATDKTLAAASGLYTGGMGFPRLTDKPDPTAVARFKNLLGALESSGKLDDLKKAVDAEEAREKSAITGGKPTSFPIPDWYGPAEIMSALMDKYATKSQKSAYAGPSKA